MSQTTEEFRNRGGALVTFTYETNNPSGSGRWECHGYGCGLGGSVGPVGRDMANEHAGQCWATE